MSPRPRLSRVRRPERGVALIIVLLVLSMLLAVVGEFALAMRLEATTTLNFRGAVSGAYLAEAAYQRAVAEILPDATAHSLDERGLLVFHRGQASSQPGRRQPGGGAPPTVQVLALGAPNRREITLGPGRFSYRVTDEEARLDLNRATPDILNRLLTELGVEHEVRDVIVDSILDWRDPNEEHRPNGAESDYYRALPVPYRSKNADFESVDELLQVRGVTPAIFYGQGETVPGKCRGLVDCLTVAGSTVAVPGTGVINVNTASDTALRALGFAEAEVALLKQGRPYASLAALPGQLRRGNQRTRSESFRIEASGEVPGQGRRTLTAIVQRRAERDGTVRATLLTWRWNPEEAAPRPAGGGS